MSKEKCSEGTLTLEELHREAFKTLDLIALCLNSLSDCWERSILIQSIVVRKFSKGVAKEVITLIFKTGDKR